MKEILNIETVNVARPAPVNTFLILIYCSLGAFYAMSEPWQHFPDYENNQDFSVPIFADWQPCLPCGNQAWNNNAGFSQMSALYLFALFHKPVTSIGDQSSKYDKK